MFESHRTELRVPSPAISLDNRTWLNDIGNKFGFGAFSLGAWMIGCAAAAALVLRFGRSRITASNTPGRIRVGGSVAPLASA